MVTYRYIEDFAPGKSYRLVRDIDPQADGSALTEAWFTVKSDLALSDAMASFSLHVTQSGTIYGGCYNYTDGAMAVDFTVPYTTSKTMLPNSTYLYDIQVRMDTGSIYTIETGRLFTLNVVTQLP